MSHIDFERFPPGPEEQKPSYFDLLLAVALACLPLALDWRYPGIANQSASTYYFSTALWERLVSGISAPWEWVHHSTRFGVLLPTSMWWAFFDLFEIRFLAYFFSAFSFYILTIVLIWLFARNCFEGHRRTIFFVAMALFSSVSKVRSDSMQLIPGCFEMGYALLGAYFVVRKRPYLGAIALFGNHLSKENSFFFLPGLLLAIRWKDVAERKTGLKFLACYLGLVLAEFLSYRIFAGFEWGRVSVLRKSYGHTGRLERLPVDNIFDLLKRFSALDGGLQSFFLLIGVMLAIILLRKTKLGWEARVLAGFSLSFVFFCTFALKKVSPIVPLLNFNARYLLPAVPFLSLLVAPFVGALLKNKLAKKRALAFVGVTLALALISKHFILGYQSALIILGVLWCGLIFSLGLDLRPRKVVQIMIVLIASTLFLPSWRRPLEGFFKINRSIELARSYCEEGHFVGTFGASPQERSIFLTSSRYIFEELVPAPLRLGNFRDAGGGMHTSYYRSCAAPGKLSTKLVKLRLTRDEWKTESLNGVALLQ